MYEPRRLPTLRVIAIVALWAAGLAMVERAWFASGSGFVALQPSPLWLVVAWVAVRAGALTAMLAGAFVGAWYALGRSADGLSTSWLSSGELWWSMALFAGVATLIRWGRDRAVALAVDESPLSGPILQNAPDGFRGEQEAIDVAVDQLIDLCGATRCSLLYVLPDGAIDFAVHRGWPADELPRRARELGSDELVAAAIDRARLVVSPDAATREPGADGGALLVAPVQQDDGVVRMLLCIDELPAGCFDEHTVRQLQSVVDWLGPQLRRGPVDAKAAPDGRAVLKMLQEGIRIGSAEQLSERLFLEDARASRYGSVTSLVALQVPKLRGRVGARKDEDCLHEAFADVVRQSDDAYRFGFTGFYVLLLVNCPGDAAQRVLERVAQRLKPEEFGEVQLKAFGTDEEATTLQELLPRVTEFFLGRTEAGLPVTCPIPQPRRQLRGDLAAFLMRLRLELGLSLRLGTELNLIEFCGRPGAVPLAPLIARHLSNMVGRSLRPTDGIYVLSPERCAVVLPNTDCLEAITVWRRIDDELAECMPAGYHQMVASETISMRDTDARHVILHLLGEKERAPEAGLLTDDELDHLAAQFAGVRT